MVKPQHRIVNLFSLSSLSIWKVHKRIFGLTPLFISHRNTIKFIQEIPLDLLWNRYWNSDSISLSLSHTHKHTHTHCKIEGKSFGMNVNRCTTTTVAFATILWRRYWNGKKIGSSQNLIFFQLFFSFPRMREEHFKAKEDEIRRRDSSPRDSLSKGNRKTFVNNHWVGLSGWE